MTRALLVVLTTLVAASMFAAGSKLFPFKSVVRRGDAIEATLPADAHWLVESPPAEPRLAKPHEIFRLSAGESLRLVERHSSYRITAHISKESSGLMVENTIDAHSFGGSTKLKTYFIRAR
ncbi:MAG TPA: hypothetical protein VJU77_15330 [Chthoniobacterales bacterium]|nr:hypothetical protein [Chthoniobacterales bacterium]